VRVTDPAAVENSRRRWPQLDDAATAEEAADRADAVLVLTEGLRDRDLDPVAFGPVVAQKRVLDGRNRLDREAWGPPGGPARRPNRRIEAGWAHLNRKVAADVRGSPRGGRLPA
jgi:UDPglucose 6-dehydrogenase